MLPVIDRSFALPAENLAFDDSLLAGHREALRFWESPAPFVVLGRSGKTADEVNVAACAAAGVPVLRRSSGGGAVLQGPGCLNYAVVLSLHRRPALLNAPESYRILLDRLARALAVPGLEVRGSDILLRGRKISGSAQRRTRGWLLHHGTLLHGLEAVVIERFLREPPRQPAHRNGRTHREFLTTLEVPPRELKQRVVSTLAGWQ